MKSLLAMVLGLGTALASDCKCTPIDNCWNEIDWSALNGTVSGRLIWNEPPAVSCYRDPEYSKQECQHVNDEWSNTTFQADQPAGYCYPLDNSCPVGDPPLNHTCRLGPAPVYSINATEPEDLAAGISFARDNNIRLVVRNTGHDILGRSAGYGSLQIWMRYLRSGIKYQADYTGCSSWKGAAFTVGGGYVWDDVYEEAFSRDLIVVGGGDPTVGVIGGYIQGGGHSPATRDFGLASDQILEARVILANGTMVVANACSHSDIFTAIRGGGGGTYGVVTSVTIKAYPSQPVVAHSLVLIPARQDGLEEMLDAVTELYAAFPAISDAGFSGYGSWSVNDPAGTYMNSSVGYQHAFAALNKSLTEAKSDLQPVLEKLEAYDIKTAIQWFQFPSYSEYYRTLSGVHQPTGVADFALASRMFNKESLTLNRTALREVIGTLAGSSAEMTSNQVLLVGGGKVLEEPEYSGVNPAWRETYLVHIVARGWSEAAGSAFGKSVQEDITYNKYEAMRKLTPSMGSYLNEADRHNPWWKVDFYGETNYNRLLGIKEKYDPEGIFYCPKCVGSTSWRQENLPGKVYGPLCKSGR
ncbi:hypothetical protein BDV18DRAFT_166365 [Aspergillus unguis]